MAYVAGTTVQRRNRPGHTGALSGQGIRDQGGLGGEGEALKSIATPPGTGRFDFVSIISLLARSRAPSPTYPSTDCALFTYLPCLNREKSPSARVS